MCHILYHSDFCIVTAVANLKTVCDITILKTICGTESGRLAIFIHPDENLLVALLAVPIVQIIFVYLHVTFVQLYLYMFQLLPLEHDQNVCSS